MSIGWVKMLRRKGYCGTVGTGNKLVYVWSTKSRKPCVTNRQRRTWCTSSWKYVSRQAAITYIHNSHTTYVVCVNFIHEWRDLQIFWEAFHGNFIYSQSYCQKSTEWKWPKKYFHIFVLMSDLGFELGPYV